MLVEFLDHVAHGCGFVGVRCLALRFQHRQHELELAGILPAHEAVEYLFDAGLRLWVESGAIDRLCRAYLAPGRRIVMPQPTFVMLPYYAALAGAEIDAVPWREGPYPLEAVLDAVTEQTAVIVVVSPNNPNGAVATAADLRALAEAAPHAVLLVDLAYAEYADEDLTAAALSHPSAVVVRTISKAWGLAGLRVGYAVGSPELIAILRVAGGPFSVSGLSLAVAERALASACSELSLFRP